MMLEPHWIYQYKKVINYKISREISHKPAVLLSIVTCHFPGIWMQRGGDQDPAQLVQSLRTSRHADVHRPRRQRLP